MKKILGLAALISFIAGSATSLIGFRFWLNKPVQAISQPVVSLPSENLEKPNPLPDLKTKEVVGERETLGRFERLMQYATEQKLSDRPMGEIIQVISKQFLGAQYKANLLDRSPEETLFISFDKFDCVLFVETVLAIARGVAIQDYSYQTFTDRLTDQRYRDGQLNGYCSRLHYFSEWITDNQKRNTVNNITQTISSGSLLNKKLNFISNNRRNYPQLVSNDANYQCIVEMENKLDGLTINYIPKNQIRGIYNKLQPGDIIGVATSIKGLDVTHTGFVYKTQNGNLGLIHASPNGIVRISQDLQVYVANVPNSIGITVARPKDPR
ncbi:MAG TPA: N-acetylmuramoyl-L-alanine amidase-like domain-containing protein [Leptolyngbyaceae cyanobacterium]